MPLEQEPEGIEAAHDVLRRVDAVDAQDQLFRPPRLDLRLSLEHDRIVGATRELVRVDADRVRDDAGRAEPARHEALDAVEEVPTPAVRVEADDIVRE